MEQELCQRKQLGTNRKLCPLRRLQSSRMSWYAAPHPRPATSLLCHSQQFYEKKQYKKGVKAADQILKKHPEHGGAIFTTLRPASLPSCLPRPPARSS